MVISLMSQAASLQVSHAMGHTNLDKPAQRVVTLFQGATDSLVALGIQPVGVVDSWTEKPTYHYLRPSLEGVTHLGLETQPNLEDIAALKPDVIIGARARHEKIYAQLQQIAPTVMTDNVYDFEQTLSLAAKVTATEDKAQQLWQTWQQRVAYFRQQIKHKSNGWPLSASILDIRADHLRIYLNNSFAGSVLGSIGFQFPIRHNDTWGMKIKTKESLPSINADVFFVISHGNKPAVQQNYRAWRSHPLWQVLKAPRTQQVYEVNQVTWLLSGGILGANLMLDELTEIYQLPKGEQ